MTDPGMIKAILWEEAKGKLRALAVAQSFHEESAVKTERWTKITDSVESFISRFENAGHHE